MNKGSKNFALFLLIIILGVLFYKIAQPPPSKKNLHYSEFIRLVKEKKIPTTLDTPLIIQDNIIAGFYHSEGQKIEFESYIAHRDPMLLEFLKENGVQYFQGRPREESLLLPFLSFLPWILLLVIIWFFMMRQIQSTGNKAMSFGRSRAKLSPDTKNKTTFKDVAGIEEAKEELEEVVEFLKEPQKFSNIGAKIPKGVLLVGPPGTGKTLLAKAIAGEAGVPFFSISGSDFVEMFVGVGASRVRDLFTQAKKSQPCIVFIDEIDAVGRLRGAGLGGGHDEREQTLNQLLVEMDGFEENEGVIIVAATNRADVLDPALLRPGRFDRQVVVDTPDITGRIGILKIHTKKIPLSEDVDLKKVARGTPGFTGADLANLANEAALLAARREKKEVAQDDMEDARDKVLMGPERRSFFISDSEKEIIAYHEAGHALLSLLLDYAEPIHKVTIVPRGRALGITQHLPEEEKHMRSRNFWIEEITVLMGGRLAEDIVFSDVTTGASNDIERATAISRRMVVEWGMSAKLGPINLSGGESGAVFLGRDYTRHTDHSEEYARIVDEEVKRIIDESFKKGKSFLLKYRKALDAIAKSLLDNETITGAELLIIAKKYGVKISSKKLESVSGQKKKPDTKDKGDKGKKTSKKESPGKKSSIIPNLGAQPA
ncbi:MAG: ATP-dependent zinc metalloprotease FtsH [Spirochaetia bacterium]|nr:ATP-dependent zinc metalloprotease FtsH [Spirochaetia bacterium]